MIPLMLFFVFNTFSSGAYVSHHSVSALRDHELGDFGAPWLHQEPSAEQQHHLVAKVGGTMMAGTAGSRDYLIYLFTRTARIHL